MNHVSTPAGEALAALRRHLERRARELQEEVRAYPTPIARCDEQLPKLIEQRTRAIEQWREAAEIETGAAEDGPAWRERLQRFLAELESSAEPGDHALLASVATHLDAGAHASCGREARTAPDR